MSVTVSMPQLGETVTEGTILRWAKTVGETIAEDDVLLEISTDKVDTEVPSPAAGTILEILVPEGETVEVGAVLCVIGEPAEQIADAPPAALDSAAAAEPVAPVETVAPVEETVAPVEESVAPVETVAPVEPAPLVEPAPVAAAPTAAVTDPAPTAPMADPVPASPAPAVDVGVLSPVVRKLAGEHGVDLSQVAGTGRGGRITRKDVQAFIDGGMIAATAETQAVVPVVVAPEPAAPAPEPAAPAPVPVASEPAAPVPEPVASAPVTPAPVASEPAAPPPEPVAPAPVPVASEPAAAVPEPAAPAAVPVASEPAAPAPAPVAPAPAAPTPAEVAPAAAAGTPSTGGDQEITLDRLRVRIAENMTRAKATAAHVWTSVEVDYEAVERVRQRHKAEWKEREGFSLTYLPFLARATIDALNAYPVVNSSFHLDEGKRIQHAQVGLGVAVDLDQQGLIVMTIKGADGLSLRGLAREVRRVAGKARSGKIEPDDISGSSFTITNPGPFGSFMSAPIINVPNVGILSTDTVTKRATVVAQPDGTDALAIHHIGYLGLTWDHRAFDGSTAVLFLRRIKDAIETWDWEHELS